MGATQIMILISLTDVLETSGGIFAGGATAASTGVRFFRNYFFTDLYFKLPSPHPTMPLSPTHRNKAISLF